MFNWLKRMLGGEGKAIIEFETTDGRTFTSSPIEWAGQFPGEKEFLEAASEKIQLEKDLDVKRLRIKRIYGNSSDNASITGNWFDLNCTK